MWDLLKRLVVAVVGKGEGLAATAEAKADAEVRRAAPGARWIRARYLLMLACFVIFAGWAWWRWHATPPAPPGGVSPLPPVATAGGRPDYAPKPVPKSTPRPRTPSRIVPHTTPAAALPSSEQPHVPVTDCVARAPELADTAVVPPSRGETHVRTYLMPDGGFTTTLDPKREPFWGLNPRRVTVGAGYGFGGQQVAVRVRWEPLRMGNVTVSGEATGWTEPGGTAKAGGMVWAEYHFGR